MKDFLVFGEALVGFYPSRGSSIIDDVPIIKTWGGDTSNFAIGVSRLGHSSSFLTRIGNDPFGRGFLELWKKNGVDLSFVDIDDDRKTGLYFVTFESGKHSLTYYRTGSAASAIEPNVLDTVDLEMFRVVHFSGISLGMSPSAQETGKELVKRAKSAGCRVSFDINYRPAQWKSREEAASAFSSIIGYGVDFLEVTDDELNLLGWGKTISDLQSIIPPVPTIVLKRGKDGAIVSDHGKYFSYPSFDVEVVDTVGAGDSFDSGFLSAIMEGADVGTATIFGTAAAALTCTGKGPLEKMPYRSEVEAFLYQQHKVG
jgi:2-dehydro-3-deoxygluconokinase